MAPITPSSRPITTPSRTTPQSKHRLNFPPKELSIPTEHPVEVVGRVRNFPTPVSISPSSALEISQDSKSIRVRSEASYRDFALDGVSVAETEDLESFYRKFVGSRIEGVRLGAKCTIMMYGPTGAGKSHTMFGTLKEPGIVYLALRDILGEEGGGESENDGGFGIGVFVQVAVLEIYNEEIYDLLSGSLNPGGVGIPKGSNTPKVRLEVMGKKAKNATYISGNEAGKISREVAKVEKRRIVKSTNCNERSSRSHCLIILDVPSVGGRLMLVDMAGSENIEQAGQTGFEAKMQTAKINQGNTALKRVVESIANGDSHVPFRDSKLTMLLQDSFEDDKSKILMILCASPDPKEMHKTISTLEYGAKAKCIVRAAHMPTPKDKSAIEESSSTLLRARITAMNQFIYKLQTESKLREKERDDAQKELMKKEEELLAMKSKLKAKEEEEIKSKTLKFELMKMEEKVLQQQEEIGELRLKLEEMELEKGKVNEAWNEIDGRSFMKRFSEKYANGEDQGMEKSMELDFGDQPVIYDVKEIKEEENNNMMRILPDKVLLSTVFEIDDEGEERDSFEDYEVFKEVVQENYMSTTPNCESVENSKDAASARKTRIQNIFRLCGNYRELSQQVKPKTPTKAHEEGIKHSTPPLSHAKESSKRNESPVSSLLAPLAQLHLGDENGPFKRNVSSFETQEKENCKPEGKLGDEMMEIYVKWEASKEFNGNMIRKLKVLKDSTLSDLRKLIEVHLEEENDKQSFSFLLLGDPTGAPVTKEKESTIAVCKLPICNNQSNAYLACLRPIKKANQRPHHIPLASLENTIPITGRV